MLGTGSYEEDVGPGCGGADQERQDGPQQEGGHHGGHSTLYSTHWAQINLVYSYLHITLHLFFTKNSTSAGMFHYKRQSVSHAWAEHDLLGCL